MDAAASSRCASVNGFSLHATSGCECKPDRAQPVSKRCFKRSRSQPLRTFTSLLHAPSGRRGTTRSSPRRSPPLPPKTRLAEWDDTRRFPASGTHRETLGVNPCSQSTLGEIFRRVRSGSVMETFRRTSRSCDFQHNVAKAATLWFNRLRPIYGLRTRACVPPNQDRLHENSEFVSWPDDGAELGPRLADDRPEEVLGSGETGSERGPDAM